MKMKMRYVGMDEYGEPIGEGEAEPEMEQCRFCYEEPNSRFNYIQRLTVEENAI